MTSPSAEDKLLERANAALAAADLSMADKLYEELVTAIEEVRGKNQKEVAAELQRLARAIESQGRIDDSMRLKQRTCEVMLRMSMAERHRGRLPPAVSTVQAAAAVQTHEALLKRLAFVYIGSRDVSAEANWLKTALGAQQRRRIDEDGLEFVILSLPDSVPLVVGEDEFTGAWLSVFEVENPDEVIDKLRQGHPHLLVDETRVPGGKTTWVKSHFRKFGVVASSCLRGWI